jgi:hypothetical protein
MVIKWLKTIVLWTNKQNKNTIRERYQVKGVSRLKIKRNFFKLTHHPPQKRRSQIVK